MPQPDLQNFEVVMTLRGLKKVMMTPIKQAQPMTPQILLDMHDMLDLDQLEDVDFWAAVLIGFFAMLRKNHLVPNHHSEFDPKNQFTRWHLLLGEVSASLLVTWSKMLQLKNKINQVPIFTILGSKLCPILAIKNMFKLVQGDVNSPLLFVVCKNRSMSYPYFL